MSKIGILDIETTGFLNQGGLIVEIGIVTLDLNSGEISPVFESLVKEPGFGPSHKNAPLGWIFRNSDLDYNNVLKAPALYSLKNHLQEILDCFSTGITAYNNQFDFGFLRDRGFRLKSLPCPMKIATPVINLPPAPGRFTPKWPSVQEAWNFLFGSTGYKEAHRALDDAIHEAQIVFELHRRGLFHCN
ncbi:MAG: 3'-5' exonuclease [Bacteroidetes bacterium]|nr:3'-5' exonuclease [Bacteroidota bacterium]